MDGLCNQGGKLTSNVSAFVMAVSVLMVSVNASAQPLPEATPESVGLSSERLARVDGLFESYIADGRMAGRGPRWR